MPIKIEKELDLIKFARDAYELSVPRGMGFLSVQSGPLLLEDAAACINKDGDLHMDYVHGRGCKLHVFKAARGHEIADDWYDHTDAEYEELLSRHGIEFPGPSEHRSCCECADCKGR